MAVTQKIATRKADKRSINKVREEPSARYTPQLTDEQIRNSILADMKVAADAVAVQLTRAEKLGVIMRLQWVKNPDVIKNPDGMYESVIGCELKL